MTDKHQDERVLHLEETVLDELERTVACPESEPIPPTTAEHQPNAVGGLGKGVRCPSSQRELLRNRFFMQ